MDHATAPQDKLLHALRAGGVADALALLNARVPHRYTGIYRLRDGLLTNTYLFDKQGQATPTALAVVPLGISFCQFVFSERFFRTRTDNSAEDRRLDGNPFQGDVLAYHGVPLVAADGELYGSLCHFDTQPWGISDEEFAVLQLAAGLIQEFLPQG